MLEALGLNNLVSSYVALSNDEDMKAYRNNVRAFLNGEIDEVSRDGFSQAEARKIRREYQLMGTATAGFALDVLSRFDLSAVQVKATPYLQLDCERVLKHAYYKERKWICIAS